MDWVVTLVAEMDELWCQDDKESQKLPTEATSLNGLRDSCFIHSAITLAHKRGEEISMFITFALLMNRAGSDNYSSE